MPMTRSTSARAAWAARGAHWTVQMLQRPCDGTFRRTLWFSKTHKTQHTEAYNNNNKPYKSITDDAAVRSRTSVPSTDFGSRGEQ